MARVLALRLDEGLAVEWAPASDSRARALGPVKAVWKGAQSGRGMGAALVLACGLGRVLVCTLVLMMVLK
jgi:hypothetical protein